MRTLEELERLAYIEGRVEEARVLAAADDGQFAIDEYNSLKEELFATEQQLEKTRGTLGKVEALCKGAEG